ncbi:Serine/threonine kinase [Sulfitobacter noctilucae]|uniref:hypothetical protein n=1 Tax=Sulfitobacter noctilucae TaxID=1342302 RepID=UPI0004690F53|nr:hypothetical protein [Sulfitobacter noctilucae]KIN75139.1 Serine/threonine kinase [Sulfitobacter noctilucae]
MSFLPYASNGKSGWIAAACGAVLVHGVALAVGFGGLQDIFARAAPDPNERPHYTITVAPLDSDTIAGLVEQQGDAGTEDGEGLDLTSPETAQSPEPERLAALTPEALSEAPEPESTDALTAQEPDAVDPEPVVPDAITPETLAPETIEPLASLPQETITPVPPSAPPPALTGPLIPDTVTALPSAPSLSPVAPSGTADLIAKPVPSQTETLQPKAPSGAMVAAVGRPAPAATPQTATAAPSAQDIAVADLLRRIQTAKADPCLLALPRRDGEEGVGLALIANSDSAMSRFSDTVLTRPSDADIRQTRVLVDERQCAALNFIRQNVDYPATRLGLRLDAVEVPSGGRLTGVLRGTAGRYVTLVLIDNNGVVQDLQRFLSFSGNFTRFDVPVTRAGPARDTKQMLLAIATRRPAPAIRTRAGRLAQDVFAGLEGEVAAQAALAVVTFDVR